MSLSKRIQVDERRAVEIAKDFVFRSEGKNLDFQRIRFEPANKDGTRAYWDVVFRLDVPEGEIWDPDICVVEVDAETGEAKWFPML